MLAVLNRNRISPVALDFGACSLRAAQLVRKGNDWHVYHWFNVETDASSAEPPALDYGTHLGRAMGPGAFSGRRAAITLTPPELEYRLLDLPSALLDRKPHELGEALQFELDRQLPWPANEAEVAAWPVGSRGAVSTSSMVAAGRRTAIQASLDLLEAHDLECVLADVTPNALIRLRAHMPQYAETKNLVWGALDIGFRACRLYLMHDARPVFARVLRGGGRELTELLAKGLHADFSVAEQYKRLYGIRPADRGVRGAAGGLGRIREDALPGMLYAILARTLDSLVADIERSYRFVLDRSPTATTGNLYLVGGGARMKGLSEFMGQTLGIDVRPLEPTGAIRNAQSAGDAPHPACTPGQFPAMAVCMGLAMTEDFT